MKSLLPTKLLLTALMAVAWQSQSLQAHVETLDKQASPDSQLKEVASLAVPEPSSAILIGTVGLMLMLRRRRIAA